MELKNFKFGTKQYILYVNIYFVCLFLINVETAKPIGTKFFVGPHMTPGKDYGC